MMFRQFLSLASLVAIATAAACSEPQQPTEPSERDLDALEAEETLREDLNDILRSHDIITARNLSGDQSGILRTRAVGTSQPGICHRDLLSIAYDYTEESPESEEGPALRAFGIRATRQFYFNRDPSEIVQNYDWDTSYSAAHTGHSRWSEDCEEADQTSSEGWFYASDERTAVRAFSLLLRANRLVQNGTISIQGCPETTDTRCREQLNQLVEDFRSISTISSSYGDPRNFSFRFGDEAFRVEFQRGSQVDSIPQILAIKFSTLPIVD